MRWSPFGIMDCFSLHKEFQTAMKFTDAEYQRWAGNHFGVLGAKWEREGIQVRWGDVEPVLGKGYNWVNLDKALSDSFAMGGVGFNPIIRVSPIRIRGGNMDIPAANYGKFTKFIELFVGLCLNSPFKLRWIQADNEPFNPRQWIGNRGTLAGYQKFVELLSNAAKSVDPTIKLILGAIGDELTPDFRACVSYFKGKELVDAFDIHHWGRANQYKLPNIEQMQTLLASNGYYDAQIFMLECGTFCGTVSGRTQDETDQACYLVKSYIYNIAHGVSLILWNNLVDWYAFGGDQKSQYNFMGLITDGMNGDPLTDMGIPRMAYACYLEMTKKLNGCDLTKTRIIKESTSKCEYEFVTPTKIVRVSWDDSKPKTLPVFT